DTQYQRDNQRWLPVDEQTYGIPFALFDKTNVMESHSEESAALVEHNKEVLRLANYNLLYVTLSSAVEQLHVICKKDIRKEVVNTKTFAGLFISYLQDIGLWSDTSPTINIGDPKRVITAEKKDKGPKAESIPFHSKMSWNDSFEIITKAGSLWGTDLQKAIDRGNLYHLLLSKIIHQKDIDPAVNWAINNGLLSENDKEQVVNYLLELVHNPKLKEFFTDHYEIYN